MTDAEPNEIPVSIQENAEIVASHIRIKVVGYENILPTYPVAELSMRAEFAGQVLAESERTHVSCNAFFGTDFEFALPYDFTQPEDLEKCIGYPVKISVTEWPRDVDMTLVEVLSKQLHVEEKEVAPATVEAKTSKSRKGSVKSTDSKAKTKDKASKASKVKLRKSAAQEVPEVETHGPLALGVAVLDLFPLFNGKTEFAESLLLKQLPQPMDDTATALLNLPRLQVEVKADGPWLEGETSIAHLTVESLYNIPNMLNADFKYQLCFMFPGITSKMEPVVFSDGKHAVEKNPDNYLYWPTTGNSGEKPTRTSYRIDEDTSNVKNKIEVNLNEITKSERPRIEWNTLKRKFLTQYHLDALLKQAKKYRRLPIEIYITPAEKEPEDISEAKSSTKTSKKDKPGKGRSSTASKGKKAELSEKKNEEDPTTIDFLHLMALVDVSSLLYPGVKKCRVACPLNTYHAKEIMQLCGQDDSHFRPSPPPQPPITIADASEGGKKSRGKKDKKEKKDKKHSKASKSKSKSSKSSESSKKGKGKPVEPKIGVDLSENLPPPPPPEPEPSKIVYSDDGQRTFLLLEIELIKPLRRARKLEDLGEALHALIPDEPSLPQEIVSTRLAQEMFDETLRTVAGDLNQQYRQYVAATDKKKFKCEHADDFCIYLQQQGMYQTYLINLMRAMARLVRTRFHYHGEVSKSSKAYQTFMSQVHVDMVQRMNTIINEQMMFDTWRVPHAHKTTSDRLLLYAKEVAELGAVDIAERYYLERICCSEDNADYWFDYAVFQSEAGNKEKALECVKKALAVNAQHRYSLLMYGLLLSMENLNPEAETCLLTLTVLQPRWSEAWCSFYLFYSKTANVNGMEFCLEMANKYHNDPGAIRDYFTDTDDLIWTTSTCESIYLKAAGLLIKMRLFEYAEVAISCDMVNNRGQCEYLLGVIAYYERDVIHALDHLTTAKELIGLDFGIGSLIGHCFAKMGDSKDAMKYYDVVLEMFDRPEDVHMVNLYGAMACDDIQDTQKARKLVLHACKLSPTAQTWMHAGGYYFKLNDLISAEQCLTQANLCDNRLPDVWGYLALINATLGKEHETDMCLMQAVKNRLKDQNLLENIEKARRAYYESTQDV